MKGCYNINLKHMVLALTLGNELKLKRHQRHQDDWKNSRQNFWYLIMDSVAKVTCNNITHIKCTK